MKFEDMYSKKMRERINEVDFYGEKDNYIHAKFGHLYKMYNFTDEFIKKYPRFVEEYEKYFMGEKSLFKNELNLVNYIRKSKIPVYIYFNFTDEPCRTWEEIYSWLIENSVGEYNTLYKSKLDKKKNKWVYIDLDNHKIKD